MNRRSFCELLARISLLAFGSPALSACGGGLASVQTDDTFGGEGIDKPIVIVGAGMAGLAAAKALHNADRWVVVLEGRERIGGRTWTTQVGPANVDLGGAWIHGDQGNPLAEFAVANGLTYTPHTIDVEYIFDGVEGGEPQQAQLLELSIIIEGFNDAVDNVLAELDANSSYADAIAYYLDAEEITGTTRRRAQFALELLASEYSAPLTDLSYENAVDGEDDEYSGGDHVVAGGYTRVVELLANGLDIRLNQSVRQIKYNSEGVTLTMTNGETLDASHAVVTVPLGVLKTDTIIFSPALPTSKRDAINRLGFGFFEKVVLVFDAQYWSGIFERTLAYIAGLGEERAFPSFIDMTEHAGAPTLVCIYDGAFAKRAQASMSERELIDNTLNILREVVGSDLPDPIASHATQWTNDPYSNGSYSYIAVGASADDMRTLAEPVGGRVLFAGEATFLRFYQTVHGAFMSGLREAERLVPGASL